MPRRKRSRAAAGRGVRRVRRKRAESGIGALGIVRKARAAAKRALESLREEIRQTEARLRKLVEEQRSFREELFGSIARRGRRAGRPAAGARRAGARRTARGRRPPKAERYFKRLPATFTLDEVRKLAGRAAGISLAQWSRAKRVRKVGKSYKKIA